MGVVAGADGCAGEGGTHRGRADAPHPPGVGNIRATDCGGSEVNPCRGCYISVTGLYGPFEGITDALGQYHMGKWKRRDRDELVAEIATAGH